MDWNLRPLAGAGPMNFGITPEDAVKLLGAPRRTIQRPSGKTQEYRTIADPILTFNARSRLIEITFSKYVENVTFEGVDVLNSNWESVFNLVQAQDNDLLDVVGSVVSVKLGLTLTNLDGDSDDEKSISLIVAGANDKYIGHHGKYVRKA